MNREDAQHQIDAKLNHIKVLFAEVAELGLEHQIDVIWDGIAYGSGMFLITNQAESDYYSKHHWRTVEPGGWISSSGLC